MKLESVVVAGKTEIDRVEKVFYLFLFVIYENESEFVAAGAVNSRMSKLCRFGAYVGDTLQRHVSHIVTESLVYVGKIIAVGKNEIYAFFVSVEMDEFIDNVIIERRAVLNLCERVVRDAEIDYYDKHQIFAEQERNPCHIGGNSENQRENRINRGNDKEEKESKIKQTLRFYMCLFPLKSRDDQHNDAVKDNDKRSAGIETCRNGNGAVDFRYLRQPEYASRNNNKQTGRKHYGFCRFALRKFCFDKQSGIEKQNICGKYIHRKADDRKHFDNVEMSVLYKNGRQYFDCAGNGNEHRVCDSQLVFFFGKIDSEKHNIDGEYQKSRYYRRKRIILQ